MEIGLHVMDYNAYIKFKIDLIVWKSSPITS